MSTKQPKKDAQHEAFKKAAREHGAEESGEAFDRAFQKIVPPKHAKGRPKNAPSKDPKNA
jgi:hypothetical protein